MYPCPECNGYTKVEECRFRPMQKAFSRRRRCIICDYKFLTKEIIAPSLHKKKRVLSYKELQYQLIEMQELQDKLARIKKILG